jgi:hypothetical protein
MKVGLNSDDADTELKARVLSAISTQFPCLNLLPSPNRLAGLYIGQSIYPNL